MISIDEMLDEMETKGWKISTAYADRHDFYELSMRRCDDIDSKCIVSFHEASFRDAIIDVYNQIMSKEN